MRILSLIFILLTLSLKGFSCICSETPIDSAFAYTPMIFEGRVVSQYENVFFYDGTEYSLITNLEIIKDYRGTRNKKIITIIGGFGCDFFFKKNETYIVFANQRESGIYTTSFCSSTRLKTEFDASKMKTIEKWSKRYYDEFDLTYIFWANDKAKIFKESESERVLRLAYYSEKKNTQIYKYALLVCGIWSIVCSGILVFRKKMIGIQSNSR
jgi:hypothetical protein